MSLILRVRFVSQGWIGGPGLNTLYFQNVADPTSASNTDASNAAARVHQAFESISSIYPGVWSGSVTPVVDVLTAATGALSTSYSVTPSALVTGAATTPLGPTPIGLLLSLNTADVADGRRVKGRAFLSPMRSWEDPDGTPNSVPVATTASFGPNITATTDTVQGVVWRRPRKARTTPPLAARSGSAHIITGVSCADKWAVLRSRRD